MTDDRENPTYVPDGRSLDTPETIAKDVVTEGFGNVADDSFVLDQPTSVNERYEIVKLLGQGGFGSVVLAYDRTLERQVAIKLPRSGRLTSAQEVEMFLNEARALAQLDHPNILPVYDFGQTDDGRCFTVSKYVDGITFSKMVATADLDANIAVMIQILQALAAAHEKGVVHRDVKPQNIFLDQNQTPYLGDFGLALMSDRNDALRHVGTLLYMSPEQCRGESHLVDGRADIFSVGVILYRMLTGAFPFEGNSPREVYERIILGTPKPPRQFNRTIARELERICLKALASRATDRYSTAYDLSDELLAWHTSNAEATGLIAGENSDAADGSTTASDRSQIVPRGLRAFGERDAGFFLRLLPGPRGRSGLPDVVEHWKDWIETSDESDPASRVGVIYGPSGCGKSSLLKAGVVPHLDAATVIVFAEATREETEKTLRRSFARLISNYDEETSLAQLGADIRTGRGVVAPESSVVVVIDQLEQWLAGHGPLESSDFAALLRQCDGCRLKAILLVRDEFWVPLSRLLSFLEVPFDTDQNAFFVDLFDQRHARRVLHEFGHAYGCLPPPRGTLTTEQDLFLQEAIENLSTEGSVYPVRIAVFAEMIKSRQWTLGSLKGFGGAEGVGVQFLEDTFESSSTPARYKQFSTAAATVLGALLPVARTAQIRGKSPTYAELRMQTGFESEPGKFAELIDILEKELRLVSVSRDVTHAVTGNSSISQDFDVATAPDDEAKYHLAHEYLIPSIRAWLRRRSRDSRAGRARINYEECHTDWLSRPTSKSLPGFFEWCRIRAFVKSNTFDNDGRRMMRAADKYYLSRALFACCVVMLTGWLSFASQRERNVDSLVKQIQTSSVTNLPSLIERARTFTPTVAERVSSWLDSPDVDGQPKLNGLATLYALKKPQAGFISSMIQADPQARTVLAPLIEPEDQTIRQAIETVLADDEQESETRLAAAQLTALTNPKSETLKKSITQSGELAKELIRHQMFNGEFIEDWVIAFDPVADDMISDLAEFAFSDQRSPEAVEATKLIIRWCRNNPDRAFTYLLDIPSWQERDELLSVIRGSVVANTARFRQLVDETVATLGANPGSEIADEQLRRAGFAAVLLAEHDNNFDLAPALKVRQSPALRAEVIYRLVRSEIDDATLARWFTAAVEREDDDVVSSLLFVLSTRSLPDAEVLDSVRRLYSASDKSVLHSAAELCLNTWNATVDRGALDNLEESASRQWRVNSLGQTLIKVPPRTKSGETLYNQDGPLADFRLEFMATEITVADYRDYFPDGYIHVEMSPTTDSPANVITFRRAVGYARWLTEEDGFQEEDQCYPPVSEEELEHGLRAEWAPYPDHQTRRGYRLPTSAEWDYAARGATGSDTKYLTGSTSLRMPDYCWDFAGSNRRAYPVVSKFPNPIGLFNTFGNISEWMIDNPKPEGRHRIIKPGCDLVADRQHFGVTASTTEDTEWNVIGFRLVRSVPPGNPVLD